MSKRKEWRRSVPEPERSTKLPLVMMLLVLAVAVAWLVKIFGAH